MEATIVLQDDGYYLDLDGMSGNVVPYGDIATLVINGDVTFLTLAHGLKDADGKAKVYKMAGPTLSSGLLELNAAYEIAGDEEDDEEDDDDEDDGEDDGDDGEEDDDDDDDEDLEDGEDEVEEERAATT